jgi:prepilin-type N-terminal cleavage/methylation domain-containing protein/prepilin-type processing-associated H-X9-DG protein
MFNEELIKLHCNCRSYRGFTLIELLVVIAIIALLAAILFPVFARARENSRRVSCQSNMKQIGIGIFQYTQDYDEKMPLMAYYVGPDALDARCWPMLIQPYLKSTPVFDCPSGSRAADALPGTGFYVGYGVNINFDPDNNPTTTSSLASFTRPAELLMLSDTSTTAARGYYTTYYRTVAPNWVNNVLLPNTLHFDGANVAYADGHVKWNKQEKLVNIPSGLTEATWPLWQPSAP